MTVGFLLGGVGVLLLIIGIIPFVQYEIYARQKFPTLISPLSNLSEYETYTDLSKAQNWFPATPDIVSHPSAVETFELSIPVLKIEKAKVSQVSDDLAKNLVHFPGTGTPGKPGNPVIFGHSVLPIFFNPKNYMTIFSTLPKLEQGDKVYTFYDGIEYTYIVEYMYEVLPNDIEILSQEGSGSYLTLVTCTPPGDPRKLKRLVVRARLKEL